MSLSEAVRGNVSGASTAFVDITQEELEVSVMIGVNLGLEVDDGALAPSLHKRHVSIRHERSAEHVGVVTARVTAERGAVCGGVEGQEGVVDGPGGSV